MLNEILALYKASILNAEELFYELHLNCYIVNWPPFSFSLPDEVAAVEMTSISISRIHNDLVTIGS